MKKELTIEEIHKETLVALKRLIEVCDEANVTYFLAYGSLLGAARHKGFIPWDDDCDVLMLRSDYDRFVEFCKSHEADLYPYKLLNKDNTENYPYGISRFCDLRYKMIRDNSDSAGMGLFIDIYPYDAMGNGKLLEHFSIQIHLIYNTKMATFANQYSLKPSSRSNLLSFIKRPFFWYAHKKGTLFFLNRLENYAHRFSMEHSKYVGCLVWEFKDIHVKKEYFSSSTLIDFEGIKVSAPIKYQELLSDWYGDYMKLPPKSMRHQTHDYKLYRVDEKN